MARRRQTQRPTLRRPFSLLVKPTSADCNLRCTYCFYLEKAALYPQPGNHRMTDEVLERMVATYMGTPQPVYSFGWQGGEPTLMGTAFFRRAVELQKRYGGPGARVANGLQTNATMITHDLASLLAEYRFLVGVSLDGPAEVHDVYRKNMAGGGSHARVMRGIELLQDHGVDFNILVLVNRGNVNRATEVYEYLVEHGFLYQQYIPCVEYDADGRLLPFAISGEEWGHFMTEVFDRWYPSDTRRVSIRHFDSVLELLVHRRYNVCAMSGACDHYFVVEHNGDVYPCDFFVRSDTQIGSIMTSGADPSIWAAFQNSPRYRAFAARKSNWNARCSSCPYLPYCSGDCPKHRYHHGDDPRQLSLLCPGWRIFYDATLDRLKDLARTVLVRDGNPATLPSLVQTADETCYCGSGKRFRNCHGSHLLGEPRRSGSAASR